MSNNLKNAKYAKFESYLVYTFNYYMNMETERKIKSISIINIINIH